MRPINLIPQEERRAHGTTTRTGALAYILVGSLAVLLIGVVMLVLTSNTIGDREDEVTSLQAKKAAAVTRADKLAPYASFQQVAEKRTKTVAELADSRFDWVRVIRQLSLILPPRVYFSTLSGAASGGGESGAAEIAGPSLTLVGCAPGQRTVAALIASLKEIDGVTRVGLTSSGLSKNEEKGPESENICEIGNKYQFEVVVAFDAAPPSPDSPTASIEVPTESTEPEASEPEASEAAPSEAEGSSGESPTSSTSTEPAG